MKIEELDIVVVGGATGGAAAALLLARAGARVTLLEKVSRPRAIGAGIGLAENGLAVLESLGLAPALAATARPVSSGRVVDARGRVLLSPPGAPRVVMIRRSELQGLLVDALASEPRITRHFGVEVAAATSDGTVRARGEAGPLELRGDLVIGADGVHSRVREGGRFDARVSPPGIAYVRALVEDETLARSEEAWTAAGIFGSFPVAGGTYLYASAGSAACRGAVAAEDLDGFRAAWARAYPPAGRILSGVGRWQDLIVNRVLRVDCRRWSDGKLVLVGDAAHAMAPNLGQGANSALVDAAVLLDELRRAEGMPAALAAYEARRRPAVRKVADTAAKLGAVAEWTGPVARWVRDRLLMPVARLAASEKATRSILQEPAEALLAIGRA
jgi:2-polyprenyl-6-methoxyphenol hydroxylase-like FAD-dependent oxidoreductase